MKKILLILLCALGFISPGVLWSQVFTVASDTVYFTIPGTPGITDKTAAVFDNITIPGSSAVNIKWHVIDSNFPVDWLKNEAFGICDASLCRNNTNDSLLWYKPTSTGTYFTCNYAGGATNAFDLSLNLANATSTGCFYVTVMLAEAVPGGYSKPITFIICKSPLNVTNVTNAGDNIILYPNPARDEVNVVYDANADVKNIVVYNTIGKVMNVYKVTGNSANLNIESVPPGIYFVRLFNSNGNVVVTRKFTRQ